MTSFEEAQRKYYRLRGKHAAGRLSDAEFQAAVDDLSLQDEQGRWWAIGAESGKWYVSQAGEWVQAEPQRATSGRACPQCGAPVREGASFCGSCGHRLGGRPAEARSTAPRVSSAAVPPQRSAAPAAAPTAQPAAPSRYAGVGQRAMATIIDTVLMGLGYFAISAVGVALASATGSGRNLGDTVTYGAGCLVGGLWFAYFIVMEARSGATLGKKILGIRVVKEDGSPCGFGASLVRNTLRVIDGLFGYLLGAILIWVSDRNQRLGDRVANTVVVSTR